jgi:hypothetical protein
LLDSIHKDASAIPPRSAFITILQSGHGRHRRPDGALAGQAAKLPLTMQIAAVMDSGLSECDGSS